MEVASTVEDAACACDPMSLVENTGERQHDPVDYRAVRWQAGETS